MKIIELAQWIFENRMHNAFVYHKSVEEVASEIARAVADGSMLYATDEHGEVQGVALFRFHQNTLHVDQILAKEPWVIKEFVKEYKKRWSSFTITAERNSKQVVYDTFKLTNKLLNYGTNNSWR